MQKNKFWLYLENYVSIFMNCKYGLVYNTLNGKYIETQNGSIGYKILSKLALKNNLYVIEIDKKDFKNSDFVNFVGLLKRYFIGDILNSSWSKKKPVQMLPFIKIENTIEGSEINYDIKELENISEISLFINSEKESDLKNNLQFLFCQNQFEYQEELDFGLINSLCHDIKSDLINFIGSNIFSYPHFKELIQLIKEKNINANFYANYLNPDASLLNLELIKNANGQLHISVSSPVNITKLQKIKDLINETGVLYFVDFKVETEEEIETFETIIDDLGITNFQLHPFYNGNNIALFEKIVYIEKSDIFDAKPSQKDIFARELYNQVHFGKLFISTEGNVYSNLHQPKLGNLNKKDISELVHFEIYKHKNWFRIRKDVTPCKSCVYNALCPPISNYEYAIGKYNLCHVWKE